MKRTSGLVPRACVALLASASLVSGAVVALELNPAAAETAAPKVELPAPLGITPNDKMSSSDLPRPVRKEVSLHWAPVPGATAYRLQVGTDDTWADTPTFTADTVSSTFALPVWLPHASYVWRVAALSGTTRGRWSINAEFTRGWRTVPTPLTPTNGTALSGRPTFSWTPVTAASAYELQVSTQPDFPVAGPAAAADTTPTPDPQQQTGRGTDTCFTTRTQVTPFTEQAQHGEDNQGPCGFSVLGTGAQLYWRVRALDRSVDGASDVDTTPASTSGISHLPPSNKPNDPDIIAPCPAASASASPAATAASTASPQASASGNASPSPSPSPSPSMAAAGETTASGCAPTHPVETGEWSSVTAFSATYSAVDPAAFTGAPVPTLPLAGAGSADPANLCIDINDVGSAGHAVCRDVPTIRWTAAPGASRYRVYFSLTDNYDNIQRIIETSATEWTPTDAWRDSGSRLSFFYAVQACTASTCGEVTSSPPSFQKRSPVLAQTAPAEGARMPGGGVTLSWADFADTLSAATGKPATSEAYAYHVQVTTSDDPDFSGKPVDDAVVDSTSYTSANVTYPDGALLWRVQPVDASGHKLPWSATRSFLLDATPPTAVVSPTVGASVLPLLRVTFSEPVSGVSASSLTLGGVASKVVVLDDVHATLAPQSPLTPGQSYQVTLSPAIKDLSANSAAPAGPMVTVNPLVDDRSPGVRYAGTWRTMASTNAVNGGFHASTPTSSNQTAATISTFGTGVIVTGCMGPANGIFKVYVDGVLRATRDTYRSFSGCGMRLVGITGLAKATHSVQVRGVGAKNAVSKGTTVGFDAVTALP